MATYVVTGVSRGIGYAFLELLSRDKNDTFIGIVRGKAELQKKIAEDANLKGRSNIHILQADLTSYVDLKQAAIDTDKIAGGKIDYLIANAGLITLFDAYDPIGSFADRPDELEKNLDELWHTNVVGNIHLFNLFLPMTLKGQTKKIIALSSGFADILLTTKYELTPGSLYATTKAAMNMVIAKYSAQYREQGVLFLALSPGMVDVGLYKDATPQQIAALQGTMAKFADYAPTFTGPITPEESVRCMKSVWEKSSVDDGNAGQMLSHKGNFTWL